MKLIEDRQIKRAVLAVLVPVWAGILAIVLTGGDPPVEYSASDIEEVCRFEADAPADWQYIVLHHSATVCGNAESFDEHHRSQGSDELAYHFVIGNGEGSGDGKIEVGSRWQSQKHGAHAGKEPFNMHGIGICLVGDFENGGLVTDAQFDALLKLCAHLVREHNIPLVNIKRHLDFRETKCPGVDFPFDALIEELEANLAEDAVVE